MRTLLFLAAPFLIACLGSEAPAVVALPEEAPASKPSPAAPAEAPLPATGGIQVPIPNAVQAFKADFWKSITIEHFQWAVAIVAMVVGLAALYDGRGFFKILVVGCIGAVFFCFVLSQLRETWVTGAAKIMKYVASVEVGLFAGLAAYKGWEGTQLLLGLVVGVYLYQNLEALALVTPYVQIAAQHSIWMVVVCTLMVALGSWMVHERYGAGRVLGVAAPLFGSSLVVSTFGYLFMFLISTNPAFGKSLNVTVLPGDVPAVFEFWCMIVFPMHSKAVGYFAAAGKNIVVGGNPVELDRVLSIFFCFVFFALSARYQLRVDKDARAQASGALKARLLVQDDSADTNALPASVP